MTTINPQPIPIQCPHCGAYIVTEPGAMVWRCCRCDEWFAVPFNEVEFMEDRSDGEIESD